MTFTMRPSFSVSLLMLVACGKAPPPAANTPATSAATATAAPSTTAAPIASSPAASRIIVHVGARTVDAESGEVLSVAAKDYVIGSKDAGVPATWKRPPTFAATDVVGGIVDGPDAIFYGFDAISDSGATLVRLSKDGKVVWKVRAEPLGVPHSKYRHEAEATIQDKKLIVASHGLRGDFVELRDLATGALLKRHEFKDLGF